MASKLITLPFRPTINLRGGVEAGAKLFVYSTGTTTPVSVYSDSALTTPLTNPVVADAFGVFPDVYYNDTQVVRIVMQQANGTVLSDTDPYVSDAASAEASADAAATSAAAAEAIARPIYADNAAGLAATNEGDFFFVDQGDGTADLYRHDAGPTATAMGRSIIIDPQASGAAALIGGIVIPVADRTALAALNAVRHTTAYLKENGREGTFEWDASDFSSEVTADTAQGIYVAPSSDATGASGAWVRQYSGPVSLEWFGAAGDGTTDDTAALQAAVAYGQTIQASTGSTFRITAEITGAHNVHLVGSGTISCTASHLFAVDGSVKLEDITVTTGNYRVVNSDNVTGLVDYNFHRVTFSGCLNVINWVVAGMADYPSGVGIQSLRVLGCKHVSFSGIQYLMGTRIRSLQAIGNEFRSGQYACIWLGAATRNRQIEHTDIQIGWNEVQTITSASASDTAAAAFQIQAERCVISNNIINSVSTSFGVSDGVEAWGIYIKCRDYIISNNTITDIASDNTADGALCSFIQVKGVSRDATVDVYGHTGIVDGNVLRKSANAFATGIGLFSDVAKVTNNKMYGIADGIYCNGAEDTDRIVIEGNEMYSPPASYVNNAMDLRLQGGRHEISQNIVGPGWANGIVLKTFADEVEYVGCYGNDVDATDASFLFDRASGSANFKKVVIGGGSLSGARAVRWNATCTPDFDFLDVDTTELTNKNLFISAAWKQGHVRCSVDLATTAGSGVDGPFLYLGDATIVQVLARGVGISTDETSYVDQEIRETWRENSGSTAQLGGTTTIHNVNSGGSPPSVDIRNSGTIIIPRVIGEASKTNTIRLSIDATFRSGT